MKIKIFATFISDGDGEPSILRIGLNPNCFPKDKLKGCYSTESDVYFQEIDPDSEVTDFEGWKPYNGKYREYGFYRDPDSKVIYTEGQLYDQESTFSDYYTFKAWMDSLVEVVKVMVYKNGELIETIIENA